MLVTFDVPAPDGERFAPDCFASQVGRETTFSAPATSASLIAVAPEIVRHSTLISNPSFRAFRSDVDPELHRGSDSRCRIAARY